MDGGYGSMEFHPSCSYNNKTFRRICGVRARVQFSHGGRKNAGGGGGRGRSRERNNGYDRRRSR